MKLVLPVPVRKVTGPGWCTFEHEPREVEVVYLTRRRAGNGWHYNAAFDHPDAHSEAVRIGAGGMLVAWIRRADHPRWRPPVFPAGAYSLVIKEG
jgi:hypothetical protein